MDRRDGIETALGVPFTRPLWSPVTEPILRDKGLSVMIVQPSTKAKTQAKAKAKAKAKPRATTNQLPREQIDPRVLALHLHYWSDLFQMNCWKLYNRYKKHLPAERRHDVDELCDHVALGNDVALCKGVEDILSAIWKADDWNAAIRDPELVRWEPLSAEQLADWQRRLAS